nr:MBOAT family O-acyltransferase [Chrysiogenes arsenatis]
MLGYFKYTDFLLENFNGIFDADIPLPHIVLPLAISFFTFQQIAYLVDSYQGQTKEYNLLTYMLFVTFFPQLIAGPIVHHKEMMPQFASRWNLVKNYRNIALGLFVFSMGLFKKVVIADTFAVWATAGFDTATTLNFFSAWATSLSYTFQLYFDFSGYTDMAIGAALLFNIKLPMNFNSPYKACDIQDFWRRWHMTLSRFLRDYLYIPLGGNRVGKYRNYLNLFAVFLLGGIWHGAGWTFVAWGALHGIALIIHRIWQEAGLRMNQYLAWFITFNFVNIAWVFFRAREWEDAFKVLRGMVGLDGVMLPVMFQFKFQFLTPYGVTFGKWLGAINGDTLLTPLLILIMVIATLGLKNSNQYLLQGAKLRTYFFGIAGTMAMLALWVMSQAGKSEFLYFNF